MTEAVPESLLPHVHVVIVDFHKATLLVRNLESLCRQYPADRMSIIVVDNSADPGNHQILRQLETVENLRLMVNDRNIGYTRACNQGARQGGGDYLLMVNPDVEWRDVGSLREFVAFLDSHPQIGICGPRQINPDGSVAETIRTIPNIFKQAARRLFPGQCVSHADYEATQPAEWLQSSCILIRRSLWDRIGGFDESYITFMADVDICYKSWLAGQGVYYFADAAVYPDGRRASVGGFWALLYSRALRRHLIDAIIFQFKYLLKPSLTGWMPSCGGESPRAWRSRVVR
ncbi:glycosyltransferase [Arenibaculum sp.]|jgi:GT2 family glycosyltransferase|uniref:glycosyltransferase n=1 Tax=Arenibaculum sp. TaxID=2865862 RepID=UPI002E0E4153|nr:glycosyltransferase [Arenibaculum sp.]